MNSVESADVIKTVLFGDRFKKCTISMNAMGVFIVLARQIGKTVCRCVFKTKMKLYIVWSSSQHACKSTCYKKDNFPP